MAIKLVGPDLNAVFSGRKFVALSPPRGDVQVGTLLTRVNTLNPKRTSVKEVAKNNIDINALGKKSTVLGDVEIAWQEKDDAALETILGANAANAVRAKIKAEAEQRRMLGVNLKLAELVYETTDLLAAVQQIEQLEVKTGGFIAAGRYFFVDSIMYAAGVKIDVTAQQVQAAGSEVSAQKLGQGGEAGMRVRAGSERTAFASYEKFPEPLTVYCSAIEFRRDGMKRTWQVPRKTELLSLGGDPARIAPTLDWMQAEGGVGDVTIDD